MNDKTSVIIFESRKDSPSKGKKKSPAKPAQSHDESLQAMLKSLSARADAEIFLTPYLVDLSPHGPAVRRLESLHGHIIAIAPLRARAIHWLLAANGLEGPFVELRASGNAEDSHIQLFRRAAKSKANRAVCCLDLRDGGAIEACTVCLDEIARQAGKRSDDRRSPQSPQPYRIEEETSQRWYPVVDRDCCRNCLECLNFCLFGVYGLDENGLLTVEQPDACRPGCPACSRVCPHHAIMFPEHSDPAVSGDLSAWEPSAKKVGKQKNVDRLVDGLDELDI